jgi:hypothetical protein
VILGDAVDPTGTMELRDRFISDLDRRWAQMRSIVTDALVTKGLFAPNAENFMHGDPLYRFTAWMDAALSQIVVGRDGGWVATYLTSATEMGTQRGAEALLNGIYDGLDIEGRHDQAHDAFNPDEPRDQAGRWTVGSGSGAGQAGRGRRKRKLGGSTESGREGRCRPLRAHRSSY